MGILRKSELEYLKELVQNNPHGKYLITGDPGSGKSFLINALAKTLRDSGIKVAPLEWQQYNHKLKLLKLSAEEVDTVFLCDGLDEFYQSSRVCEAIMNSTNGFICTARRDKFNVKFDHKVRLQPLTEEQAISFVNDYLLSISTKISEDRTIWDDLYKLVLDEEISPLLLNIFISYSYADKDKAELLRKLLSNNWQVYMYGKKVSLQAPEIIVPEKKIIRVPIELKNDINVVNNSLLESVSRTPSLLDELTSRQFEELVCELFQKKGYNVRLTKQTRDGGKDIIVLNSNFLGDFIIYAECKKYARSHPVGVALVRQLYGTVEADKATAGIMITTSSFSKEARRFRETVRGRMSLMDYTELIQELIKFK